jgi:hypothetical protein
MRGDECVAVCFWGRGCVSLQKTELITENGGDGEDGEDGENGGFVHGNNSKKRDRAGASHRAAAPTDPPPDTPAGH